MAEATGASILTHGDSHGLDRTSVAKELPDGVLGCVESEVATEDSVSLAWCAASRSAHLRLVAREFDLDLSVVQPGAIGLLEGSLGLSLGAELHEADSLHQFALGQLAILREVSVQAVLSRVE